MKEAARAAAILCPLLAVFLSLWFKERQKNMYSVSMTNQYNENKIIYKYRYLNDIRIQTFSPKAVRSGLALTLTIRPELLVPNNMEDLVTMETSNNLKRDVWLQIYRYTKKIERERERQR